MKRPNYWLRGALLVCLALGAGAFMTLRWLVPRYVVRAIELAGGNLVTDQVELSFPLTTTLTGLRLAGNTPQSALSIQQIVMRPYWFSIPSRTLWLKTLEIRRPLLRLTRTKAGTMLWPASPIAGPAQSESSIEGAPPTPGPARPAAWRIRIDALTITGGVIEFVDEKPAAPFHGVFDHIVLGAGPMTLASDGADVFVAPHHGSSGTEPAGMSFAVRGKVAGAAGASAPTYCSGWIDPVGKGLQASCRLEPLALTAFDPYYHGRTELRVYTATLNSTSQWDAKANRLTARVQLELNSFSEGDLSVSGRTIVDIKKLPGGQEPRLRGEVSFSGPLDNPWAWQAAFQPGDERVQALVERLLERGVRRIKIALGDRPMHISMPPSTEATMTDIEAASREIQDALEILAGPMPTELPAVASGPATEVPASVAASAPAPEAAAPVEASSPATAEPQEAPAPTHTPGAPAPAPATPQEQTPVPAPASSPAPAPRPQPAATESGAPQPAQSPASGSSAPSVPTTPTQPGP